MTKPTIDVVYAVDGEPMVVLIGKKDAEVRKSYYCFDCKQLRLSGPHRAVQQCANCWSTNITVDVADSPRLRELRFGAQPSNKEKK